MSPKERTPWTLMGPVGKLALFGVFLVACWGIGYAVRSGTPTARTLKSCPRGMVAESIAEPGSIGVLDCYSKTTNVRGPLVTIYRHMVGRYNFSTATKAYPRPDGTLVVYAWAEGNHKLSVFSAVHLYREECVRVSIRGYTPTNPICTDPSLAEILKEE